MIGSANTLDVFPLRTLLFCIIVLVKTVDEHGNHSLYHNELFFPSQPFIPPRSAVLRPLLPLSHTFLSSYRSTPSTFVIPNIKSAFNSQPSSSVVFSSSFVFFSTAGFFLWIHLDVFSQFLPQPPPQSFFFPCSHPQLI